MNKTGLAFCKFAFVVPFMIMIIGFPSCNYENYLACCDMNYNMENYIWTRKIDSNSYKFIINESSELLPNVSSRFYGLLIQNADTFFLRGHQKGSLHPTGLVSIKDSNLLKMYDWPHDSIEYLKLVNDTLYLSNTPNHSIWIWQYGNLDSLRITKFIDDTIVLYKRKRSYGG